MNHATSRHVPTRVVSFRVSYRVGLPPVRLTDGLVVITLPAVSGAAIIAVTTACSVWRCSVLARPGRACGVKCFRRRGELERLGSASQEWEVVRG